MIKRVSPNKRYRIVTESDYFYKKYGVHNPVITNLHRDEDIFGDIWINKMSVPAVVTFMIRQVSDNIYVNNPKPAYYGTIEWNTPNIKFALKELVFIDELELIK
jgi:hypothetical protein